MPLAHSKPSFRGERKAGMPTSSAATAREAAPKTVPCGWSVNAIGLPNAPAKQRTAQGRMTPSVRVMRTFHFFSIVCALKDQKTRTRFLGGARWPHPQGSLGDSKDHK